MISSNFAVGIELLAVGILVVFAVLVLLMWIMQMMSAVVSRAQKHAKDAPGGVGVTSSAGINEEELAAVVAVMSNILPKTGTPIRLNIVEGKN